MVKLSLALILDGMVCHGTPTAAESYFHAWPSATTELISSLRSAMLCASGPATGTSPGIPFTAPETCPPKGIRSVVGLKPYTPQHSAGMRIEPAMSVPTPRIDPRKATNAPSPPLDPPAVRVVLCGLRVRPKMLFSESAVWVIVSFMFCEYPAPFDIFTIIVCGILVFTYNTAPSSRSIFTSAEFVVAGSFSRNATYPIVDCTPSTQKLSFILIGRPCRGPTGFPSRWRYSSRYLARSNAWGKKVSVRHEVYIKHMLRSFLF